MDLMVSFCGPRSGVKAALVLMPLLGITWMFGLFSVNEETVVFQYLFAIVNSLQVFILRKYKMLLLLLLYVLGQFSKYRRRKLQERLIC